MPTYRLVLDLEVADGYGGLAPKDLSAFVAAETMRVVLAGHRSYWSITGCAISRPLARTQTSSGMLGQPVRRIDPETGEVLT